MYQPHFDRFMFDGKRSLYDMGIHARLVKRPLFSDPKTIYQDIPGKDGELNLSAVNPIGRKNFKPLFVEFECHFATRHDTVDFEEKLNELSSWLMKEEDCELYIGANDNYCYLGHVISPLNLEMITDFSATFPLIFKCQPFKYLCDTYDIELPPRSAIQDDGLIHRGIKLENSGYFTNITYTITGSAPEGLSIISDKYPDSPLIINQPFENGTLFVDMENMIVTLNGVSCLHACQCNRFHQLHPGYNNMTVKGKDLAAEVIITYRERYV